MRPMSIWADDLPGADRVIVDGHSYFVFNGANTARIDVAAVDGLPGGTWPAQACRAWGPEYNASRNNFGPSIGGEFSAAPNDCALFINGVGSGSDHPQCAEYQDWENYTTGMKEGIKNYVLASFDSFGDWFFWTWKIGPSSAGRVEAPLWSYSLGLANGWMPTDPREATGKCLAMGVTRVEWDGTFEPARTGGVPTPTIPASYTAQYPWPPASISDVAGAPSSLPRFTEPVPALTLPPFTSATPTATST
jgi:glucan 1,3-beta-glucosidase